MSEAKFNQEIRISQETYVLITKYAEKLKVTYDEVIRCLLKQEHEHEVCMKRIRDRLMRVEQQLCNVIVDEMPEEE